MSQVLQQLHLPVQDPEGSQVLNPVQVHYTVQVLLSLPRKPTDSRCLPLVEAA